MASSQSEEEKSPVAQAPGLSGLSSDSHQGAFTLTSLTKRWGGWNEVVLGNPRSAGKVGDFTFIWCSHWAKMQHLAPALCSQHAAQTRCKAANMTKGHLSISAEVRLPRPELVAFLAGSLCARRPGRLARRSTAATVELLVDADQHGIDEIKEAIEFLQKQGEVVNTRVFAAPGRSQNKKWARFLRKPRMRFERATRQIPAHDRT